MSKLERAHEVDLLDVQAMERAGHIERDGHLEMFALIEPGLVRYPAIDQSSFRARVEAFSRV